MSFEREVDFLIGSGMATFWTRRVLIWGTQPTPESGGGGTGGKRIAFLGFSVREVASTSKCFSLWGSSPFSIDDMSTMVKGGGRLLRLQALSLQAAIPGKFEPKCESGTPCIAYDYLTNPQESVQIQ